jgi:hypothetical protein
MLTYAIERPPSIIVTGVPVLNVSDENRSTPSPPVIEIGTIAKRVFGIVPLDRLAPEGAEFHSTAQAPVPLFVGAVEGGNDVMMNFRLPVCIVNVMPLACHRKFELAEVYVDAQFVWKSVAEGWVLA